MIKMNKNLKFCNSNAIFKVGRIEIRTRIDISRVHVVKLDSTSLSHSHDFEDVLEHLSESEPSEQDKPSHSTSILITQPSKNAFELANQNPDTPIIPNIEIIPPTTTLSVDLDDKASLRSEDMSIQEEQDQETNIEPMENQNQKPILKRQDSVPIQDLVMTESESESSDSDVEEKKETETPSLILESQEKRAKLDHFNELDDLVESVESQIQEIEKKNTSKSLYKVQNQTSESINVITSPAETITANTPAHKNKSDTTDLVTTQIFSPVDDFVSKLIADLNTDTSRTQTQKNLQSSNSIKSSKSQASLDRISQNRNTDKSDTDNNSMLDEVDLLIMNSMRARDDAHQDVTDIDSIHSNTDNSFSQHSRNGSSSEISLGLGVSSNHAVAAGLTTERKEPDLPERKFSTEEHEECNRIDRFKQAQMIFAGPASGPNSSFSNTPDTGRRNSNKKSQSVSNLSSTNSSSRHSSRDSLRKPEVTKTSTVQSLQTTAVPSLSPKLSPRPTKNQKSIENKNAGCITDFEKSLINPKGINIVNTRDKIANSIISKSEASFSGFENSITGSGEQHLGSVLGSQLQQQKMKSSSIVQRRMSHDATITNARSNPLSQKDSSELESEVVSVPSASGRPSHGTTGTSEISMVIQNFTEKISNFDEKVEPQTMNQNSASSRKTSRESNGPIKLNPLPSQVAKEKLESQKNAGVSRLSREEDEKRQKQDKQDKPETIKLHESDLQPSTLPIEEPIQPSSNGDSANGSRADNSPKQNPLDQDTTQTSFKSSHGSSSNLSLISSASTSPSLADELQRKEEELEEVDDRAKCVESRFKQKNRSASEEDNLTKEWLVVVHKRKELESDIAQLHIRKKEQKLESSLRCLDREILRRGFLIDQVSDQVSVPKIFTNLLFH